MTSEPTNVEHLHSLLEAVPSDEEIFGPIATLMADRDVTEILINDYDRIYREKNGVFERCREGFLNSNALQRFVRKLLQLMDKCADRRSPLVDGVLPDGTRAHIALPPVTNAPTVSLRRHHAEPLAWQDLIEAGALPFGWAEKLARRFGAGENILLCGTTGSGKTTLARALLMNLPERERIITIEDTPELHLAGANCVSLISRQVPDDLAPPISLSTLVKHALRMRPDRIVVGEIRGEEALVFLDALSTGHRGSVSSIHGGTCREALSRLESLASRGAPHWPLETLRTLIFQSVKLVVCMGQVCDGPGAKRRQVIEVAEVAALESFGFLLSPWPTP